jgi:hypothetical protein
MCDDPIIRAAKSRIERERDFTMTERPVYPADDYDPTAALYGRQQPGERLDQRRKLPERRVPGARRHPDLDRRVPGHDRREH